MTLDPWLADLLLAKSEYQEQLPWEQVFSRCLNKLSAAYRLSRPGEPDVVKKGRLEAIMLSVMQRAGNKKVHDSAVLCIQRMEAFTQSSL